MPKTITIDPVTRVEGHGKVTIRLNDDGSVDQARFHVAEFRGFERFCEGRPLEEMAGITARICGICPVSHLMASAKTGDAIYAVKIPPTGEKLRRVMNLGQIIQSHALSFFHLSSPDFVFGLDSDPKDRNIFGVMKADPDLARKGIRLRQFGQRVIEILGGKKIHPAWVAPGGVRTPLTEEGRQEIISRVAESKETTLLALSIFKGMLDQYKDEVEVFGNFPSLFMSLVGEDGEWEHYGGSVRFVDSQGNIVADKLDPMNYKQYVGEAVEADSYLKFPYYMPLGYPDGIYRVGPLARLNTCSHIGEGAPLAAAELMEFRQRGGGTVNMSLYYHYARLIEILAGVEFIERYMDDPHITDTRVRSIAGINQLEAVGVSEAPRGTLFHHYAVDADGMITKVNLIIATGQNNLAINNTVDQIAKHYIKGPEIPEGMLNRVEAGVRAYDPCLSCSTHAAGQMPLKVTLIGADGSILDEVTRG